MGITAGASESEPRVTVEQLDELLAAAEEGRFSKEGIPAVLAALLAGAPTFDTAVERAGFTGPPVDDLDVVADRIVRSNSRVVQERGEAAFSALMGDVMREVRGHARRQGGRRGRTKGDRPPPRRRGRLARGGRWKARVRTDRSVGRRPSESSAWS